MISMKVNPPDEDNRLGRTGALVIWACLSRTTSHLILSTFYPSRLNFTIPSAGLHGRRPRTDADIAAFVFPQSAGQAVLAFNIGPLLVPDNHLLGGIRGCF